MIVKSGEGKYYIEQQGEGRPVVVFEAGMGEDLIAAVRHVIERVSNPDSE